MVSLAPNQLPPPQHSLRPRGLSCLLPGCFGAYVSLRLCLGLSVHLSPSLLPFPVGLTPDVLEAPGKKALLLAFPTPTPAPEPTPTQLLLVPGSKQREVSPPGIWKGVRMPKSPWGVGGQQPCSAVAAGGKGLCVPGHCARLGAGQGRARRPSEFIHSASVATVNRCPGDPSLSEHCTEELVRAFMEHQLCAGPRQVPWSRNRTSMILSLLWLFLFLATPSGSWYLISPTRDQTGAPPRGEAESPKRCAAGTVWEQV